MSSFVCLHCTSFLPFLDSQIFFSLSSLSHPPSIKFTFPPLTLPSSHSLDLLSLFPSHPDPLFFLFVFFFTSPIPLFSSLPLKSRVCFSVDFPFTNILASPVFYHILASFLCLSIVRSHFPLFPLFLSNLISFPLMHLCSLNLAHASLFLT